MANPVVKCGDCDGNFWPSSGQGKAIEHPHLAEPKRGKLKLKYLKLENRGPKNKPAGSPSDPSRANVKTLKPRRRAYGPF